MRLMIALTELSPLSLDSLPVRHVLSRDEKVRWAKPTEKENRGVGGDSCPHGREEKLSSPPPTLGSDASARLLCTLRRDPWGSEASRALHRHRGGPNLKNAPALTPGLLVHHNVINLYIDGTNLTLRSTR